MIKLILFIHFFLSSIFLFSQVKIEVSDENHESFFKINNHNLGKLFSETVVRSLIGAPSKINHRKKGKVKCLGEGCGTMYNISKADFVYYHKLGICLSGESAKKLSTISVYLDTIGLNNDSLMPFKGDLAVNGINIATITIDSIAKSEIKNECDGKNGTYFACCSYEDELLGSQFVGKYASISLGNDYCSVVHREKFMSIEFTYNTKTRKIIYAVFY